VGVGYIGLPTATAFATHGIHVLGVDINPNVVEAIKRGQTPFVEPDLAFAVSGAVASGHLSASSVPAEADAFIVAVPTPVRSDRSADLTYIESATRSIAPVLKKGDLVVLESTSPPGTTAQISQWLAELRPDLAFPHAAGDDADIRVAHCPERVLPGRIMIEIVTNARIIGGVSSACAEAAESLYRIFARGEICLTDAMTAEIAKLTENASRDVNIAFANELSMLCDGLDVDVHRVIELANRHPRVNLLQPGPGVGGHCIAVDPWFLISVTPARAKLMRAAREVNDAKPQFVLEQVDSAARLFRDPVVACLGLAYKANVDDMRESPAMKIAAQLASSKVARLLVVEPHVSELPAEIAAIGSAKLADLQSALSEADIVLLLVDHDEFRSVPPTSLQGKVVLDTRGIWR
jgi:UDP-N-acetyl-D-mannosaminuronic acid dehydrogenase